MGCMQRQMEQVVSAMSYETALVNWWEEKGV